MAQRPARVNRTARRGRRHLAGAETGSQPGRPLIIKQIARKLWDFATETAMQLWSGWRLPGLRRGAARRSAPPARPLVAGAAVVLVGVMLLTAWLLWDARRVAWEHAAQSSENVASTIEHDITHTIEVYDLSLQAVVDSLRLPGIDALTPTMRNEFLFDRAATAPYLGSIRVLDETGRVTIDSRNLSPPNENFAGRRFFRSQRSRSHRGLYVGRPVKSPDGVWSMALSRRLEHPDGSFAGVVVGTLKLDFFSRLFSLIDPGAGGTVTLLRDDGTLIDREPYDEKFVGREFPDLAIFGQYPRHKMGTL